MEKKVLVIGSLNYDIILNAERLPEKGETYVCKGADRCCGGKGGNQAAQCGKLNIKTYMAGRVGRDFSGEILLQGLKEAGVDTSLVEKDQTETGLGVVYALEDGSVYAGIVPGANSKVSKADVEKAACFMDENTVVILQLEIPVETVEYAVETAKKRGSRIILNTAPAGIVKEDILRQCDYVVANEVEAEALTGKSITDKVSAGEAAACLARKLGNTCIFTLGSQGAVAGAGENIWFCPAYAVKAVETTGAGDSFIGGLAWGIVEGMEFSKILSQASMCSAITVQSPGGQPSMPTLSKVLEFRKKAADSPA